MPKKVSETQKKEIANAYVKGIGIKEISLMHDFSIITITKQLKKILGKEKFDQIKNKDFKKEKSEKKISSLDHKNKQTKDRDQLLNKTQDIKSDYDGNLLEQSFFEVIPICNEIDFDKRKDFTSEPIEDFDFPKIVYMIVNKNIELEYKYLKDFPRWQFLPEDELNRKTIEVFDDIKTAKSFCNKEQKVIKVPNTNVFKLVAPLLLNRGISRIVMPDRLISL